MKKREKIYKKLPTGRRKFIGRDTLWAGPDHLLLIISSGISETYRRFYYKDIKAIQITRTKSGMAKNIVLSFFMVVIALWALAMRSDALIGFAVFLGIICLTLFAYLMVSLIQGPSCDCRIVTAVQHEKLPAVTLLKRAEKMMRTVGPLIEKEQGRIGNEMLDSLFGEMEPEMDSKLAETMPPPKLLKQEKGHWHRAVFVLLIACGGLSIATLFIRSAPLFFVGTLLFIAMGICAIVSVVRQTGSDLKGSVKGLGWLSIAYLATGFIAGYIQLFYFIIKNPDDPMATNNPLNTFNAMSSINPFDYPLLLGFESLMIVAFLVTGIAGLVLIRK